MKNILEQVKDLVAAVANEADIVVEIPPVADFGHFATNAAMVLAKKQKANPREIAARIIDELKKSDMVANAEIAGPGFINITLKNFVWNGAAQSAIDAGEKYGESKIGGGRKVNVEFLSANPTGPMHVGHCRGAVFGNAVAELLKKAGWAVSKEYYVNDYGNQVDALANSVHWRYEELCGMHAGESLPEGLYPGEYIIPVAKKIFDENGDAFAGKPRAEWVAVFKKIASGDMMALVKEDLAKLGIFFDVFASERELVESGAVEAAVERLDKMGLLYQGTLPRPMAIDADDEDWKPEVQTLFRASNFGDSGDRVILRADGSKTYFASDIAYHYDKFRRGFIDMINVWGADHAGYVQRLKAAVAAITDGKAKLEIDLCQMVSLLKDGKPFRMSKRAGNFVMVADILNEVDADVLKTLMLSRTAETHMSFDLAKTSEQSKDNPIYYIQYAMGRLNSVMENYKNTFGAPFSAAKVPDNFYAELGKEEREIIRDIASFPNILESAAMKHVPSLVVQYLERLAQKFHSIWTIGAKSGDKFINPDDRARTDGKMLMLRAMGNAMKSGLAALGIRAVDKLH